MQQAFSEHSIVANIPICLFNIFNEDIAITGTVWCSLGCLRCYLLKFCLSLLSLQVLNYFLNLIILISFMIVSGRFNWEGQLNHELKAR